MDDLDLDALERACCNVPPYTVDKWRERGDVGDASIVDADDNEIAEMRAWDMGAVHAYMAATAPATVLALITRLRAAEDALTNARRYDAVHVCERVIREAEGRGNREGLRAAEARTAWQPIETAPFGEWVLVYAGYMIVASRCPSGIPWVNERDDPMWPTHWMPLPAAPEAP